MGLDLGDLITPKPIDYPQLKDKALAIDAYNALYQFLAIIRQPDGTALHDAQGRITSHLSGIFYRTVNFLERGLKPVYVFDGKPPELKRAEIEQRIRIREQARIRYAEAYASSDYRGARKYAQQTTSLRAEMTREAKGLLEAMGVPWIQAPSEGEAQAAYLAAKGECWASVSQDFDSLLFGTPRLIRNLTISGERKLPGRDEKVEVNPEMIDLAETLSHLGITREQLVAIGVLIGTDFNPEGIRGVGPKKAYSAVKEHGKLEAALKNLAKDGVEFEPDTVADIFLKPNVTDAYRIEWRPLTRDRVVDVLCGEYSFSQDRVNRAIDRVEQASKEIAKQKGLESWLG